MTAEGLEKARPYQNVAELDRVDEDESIPLESLSHLTGFPVDFIKKELLITTPECSLKELRKLMVSYLQSNIDLINSSQE